MSKNKNFNFSREFPFPGPQKTGNFRFPRQDIFGKFAITTLHTSDSKFGVMLVRVDLTFNSAILVMKTKQSWNQIKNYGQIIQDVA